MIAGVGVRYFGYRRLPSGRMRRRRHKGHGGWGGGLTLWALRGAGGRCPVRVPFPAHARLPIGRAVRQALQGMGAMMQGIQGMPNMGGMPMGPGMHRRVFSMRCPARCPSCPARCGAWCPVATCRRARLTRLATFRCPVPPTASGVGSGWLRRAPEECHPEHRRVAPPRKPQSQHLVSPA